MKFVLEITELDNAALSGGDFYGPREFEIARMLRRAADHLENGDECGPCMDINGNKVGKFGFVEE